MNPKIAFKHPKQKDVLIFIVGDMPHIVKRMVYVLESSSKKDNKRKLVYGGKKLNLDMLRNVWECDAGKMGNIRTNILTDGTKLRNPKPTQNDMRKHTARRTGTRTSGMFTKLNKANTSGDQALYTDDNEKTTTEIKWILKWKIM